MKIIITLICLIISLTIKSQSTECISRFDKAVKTINNFNNCSLKQEYFDAFNIDLVYVLKNCPGYYAQNQEKVNQAKSKADKIFISLNCNGVSSTQTSPNQTSSCTAISQPTSQPNSTTSQYKENLIEYSNSKKNQPSTFSNLNNEDKKKLIENIEATNNMGEFDENEINKLLDIKEEVITKPIFDTYYYSSFSDAIYKIAQEGESSVLLEDVAGYSFDVTFTVTKNGFIENIRFQNQTGVGSTPKINQSLKAIIYEIGSKGLWIPATKDNVKINDDVTIEIDVDRYLKSYYYAKNLNKDVAIIEQKEKIKNENKNDIIKDDKVNDGDKSYYQKFIEFKNGLINDLNFTNSEIKNETTLDKSAETVDFMDSDVKTRLMRLLTDPKKSLSEIIAFITLNISSVKIGTKKILMDNLKKIEEDMSEIK